MYDIQVYSGTIALLKKMMGGEELKNNHENRVFFTIWPKNILK